MFGIGLFEMLVIAAAALIFVGPKKLPEVARQFGRFFVQIKRMSTEVRSTIDQAMHDAELDLIREEREKVQKLLADNQKLVTDEAKKLMDTKPSNVEAYVDAPPPLPADEPTKT
jgi:Tat protein translocase TatB subunit